MDLGKYNLVVIKVGTNVIVEQDEFDIHFLSELTREVALLVRQGKKVLIVTSGAIGFGKKKLNCGVASIVEQQALAAIGQVLLMNEYTKRFDLFGINCAQVLLSGHDLLNETCSSNIKNTFDFFFQNNIVAIVNENDVVATEELRKNGVFTDNDSLASLIATQIRADLLVILTKTNGLIGRDGVVLSEFNSISQLLVMGSKSSGGRGGIDSKIKAIINASSKGCDVFVSGKGSFCGFSSGLAKGTMTRKNSFLDKGGSIKIP